MKKQELIDAWYKAAEYTKQKNETMAFFNGYLMASIEDLTGEKWEKLQEAIKDIPYHQKY